MPPAASRLRPERIAHGVLSGLAASGAMSVVFGIAQLAGAMDREPPRLIVDTLFSALPERARGPVAGILHLGYGAMDGAAYTTMTRPERRGALTGALFGLGVWASSYEGWVPAAGVMPPAHRDRPARAAALLLGHVVYGATLGEVARRMGAAGEDGAAR